MNTRKAGVRRELLAIHGSDGHCHVMRRHGGDSLEKEIMQGTMPSCRARARPRMTWMVNIESWPGLSMGELIRKVNELST